MLYLLDSGSPGDVRYCKEYYPLAGVTTNPSIIAKEMRAGEKRGFWQLLEEIRGIIGPKKMLHVQSVQKQAEGIVEEARLLESRIGGALYVKIPVGAEGLKAAMKLKSLGIGVTMTAVFTPAQALMAAEAGADFVAPYVNRLDNVAGGGCGVVEEIVRVLELHKSGCKCLAASFKNTWQVHNCAMSGCQSVTMSADIFRAVLGHPLTDAAVEGFARDWKSVFGERTILSEDL